MLLLSDFSLTDVEILFGTCLMLFAIKLLGVEAKLAVVLNKESELDISTEVVTGVFSPSNQYVVIFPLPCNYKKCFKNYNIEIILLQIKF